MNALIIAPKTKIHDLLEAYPQLEEVLIGLAPEFKKLRNPLLRKTIAKVANISQVAAIGGLKVEHMVNLLREKVGQRSVEILEDTGTGYIGDCPDWFRKESVSYTVDIREKLNRGEQPIHEVLSSVKKLGDHEILEIIAPFIPAPLIDRSESLGYTYWTEKRGEGDFRVYFRKK